MNPLHKLRVQIRAQFRAKEHTFRDYVSTQREELRAQRKGFPTGGILHKGSPFYDEEPECERYLVVSEEEWIQVAADGTPLRGVAADFYGRIHWEQHCPHPKAWHHDHGYDHP
jgi:hypothetical protein